MLAEKHDLERVRVHHRLSRDQPAARRSSPRITFSDPTRSPSHVTTAGCEADLVVNIGAKHCRFHRTASSFEVALGIDY